MFAFADVAVAPAPQAFPLEGKASLRIEILCQRNRGSVKSDSDHQNPYFTGTPAAGATIGMLFHGNCGAARRSDDVED